MPVIYNKSYATLILPSIGKSIKGRKSAYLTDEEFAKMKGALIEYEKMGIIAIEYKTKGVTMQLVQDENGNLKTVLQKDSDKVQVETNVDVAEKQSKEAPAETTEKSETQENQPVTDEQEDNDTSNSTKSSSSTKKSSSKKSSSKKSSGSKVTRTKQINMG